MRLVPMEGDRFHLSAEEAVKHCDENTIGVVAILGSTFDGSYEPVAEICAALDELAGRHRPRRPGARRRRVGRDSSRRSSTPTSSGTSGCRASQSINASGHKYGLVYPGVGWIVWRDADALPDDLIFWVNYLGDNMPTFALNFSRPGSQVVAQYYNFLRLGFDGLPRGAGLRARRRDAARRPRSRSSGRSSSSPTGDELPGLRVHADGRDRRTTPCSTSRTRCASAAGWCRRTRSPRTARTSPRCASSCGAASATTWPTCSSPT